MTNCYVKPLKAFDGTVVFLLVLLAIYYVHVRYFRVDVVFYSALLDVALASAVATLLLLRLPFFSIFGAFEKFQLSVFWLLLGYIYAISVPTVIDRSLSFYLLEKIQQRGGGIRLDRFEYVFAQEYMREHQLVAVRLTEQQASGTVTVSNGCVKLTARGRLLASFSRIFRQYLLPRRRRLLDRYTDELTDPFRHSQTGLDYRCR